MDQKILNVILIAAIVLAAAVIGLQVLSPAENQGEGKLKFSNLTGFATLQEAQQAMLAGASQNELTVYNQNFGVVKESASYNLKAGQNDIKLSNVPESIEPSSLIAKDLTDSKASFTEQQYVYDTLNEERLLKQFLNSPISIEAVLAQGPKTYSGKLVAYNDRALLIQNDSGVQAVNRSSILTTTFTDKAGIESTPVMKLKLSTQNAGSHNLQFSYLADNVNWSADYVAELNQDKLNLKGYVTVENNTGKDFSGVQLNVVAGSVNRATATTPPIFYEKGIAGAMPMQASDSGFSQSNLGEYKFYALNTVIDLQRNSSKQISFMESQNIPVKQEYTFDSSMGEGVSSSISFKNNAASGIGIALPAGSIKTYQTSSTESLQFVGEDSITNKTVDDTIELKIGKTFDLTAEKKQTDSQNFGNCTQNSYSVALNNQKSTAVMVNVLEHVYGDSQVLKSSVPAIKDDATTYKFPAEIKAGSQATVTYTIQSCYR